VLVASGDGHVGGPSECRLVIGDDATADLTIAGALDDAAIVQSYHLLWELVQVCLEHPGLVGAAAGAGGDSTGFLYPFLDAAEFDEDALRRSLESSAAQKRAESGSVAADALHRNAREIEATAASISDASHHGGRVFTIGNGGSSTDAARLARLLRAVGVDARSLAADYAVLSALANDLGAEHIFARQLEAFARPGDVVIACSTSGASANLLSAFEYADTHKLVGVGIAGYGGGGFAHQTGVDHCLLVESTSVHRIQEGQAAILTSLCQWVERMGAAT
jgi:D-sedoheptulose 7-phosphate isomerase